METEDLPIYGRSWFSSISVSFAWLHFHIPEGQESFSPMDITHEEGLLTTDRMYTYLIKFKIYSEYTKYRLDFYHVLHGDNPQIFICWKERSYRTQNRMKWDITGLGNYIWSLHYFKGAQVITTPIQSLVWLLLALKCRFPF